MNFVLILGLLFPIARAELIEKSLTLELLARRIAHARLPEDVKRLHTQYQNSQIAAGACRLQLRGRLAPVACYEIAELERPSKALRDELDAKCVRAARALRLPSSDLNTNRSLSPICRRELEQARQILQYRAAEPDSDWSAD